MQFAFSRGDIPGLLYFLLFPLAEAGQLMVPSTWPCRAAPGVPGSQARLMCARLRPLTSRLGVPRGDRGVGESIPPACSFSYSEIRFFIPTPGNIVPEFRR